MKRALLLGALLAVAGCGGDKPSPGAAAPGSPAAVKTFGAFDKANLVIISLDTLRADDTTMGGGPPEITPTIAKFAAESTYFEQARTQAPHTAPSHMSLFTSTLPSVHGVQNVSFKKEVDEDESKAIIVPSRADVPTLAEVLKAAGFHTVGLTDGGNLNPPHGFARGFDTYTYDLQGAEGKVKLGAEWVGKLAAAPERFFLFWHTYQIHAPYCPPLSYVEQWAPKDYQGVMRDRVESLQDLSFQKRWAAKGSVFWKDRDSLGLPDAAFLHGVYRAGVRYTDDQLAGLFQSLRDSGVLDRSIVVLVGDHGEEFFDHGHWQHEDLFEECLRVPLVVRLPDAQGAGQRIRTPVALIDVMPTVLELLGIDTSQLSGLPGPVRHGGVSLAETLLTGHEPRPRAIISEFISDRAKGGDYEQQVAINANGMSFIHDKVRALKDADGKALRDKDGNVLFQQSLYDLSRDPGEKTDLVPQGGAILESFRKLYGGYETIIKLEQAGAGEQKAVPIPPEMKKQLDALGYTGQG